MQKNLRIIIVALTLSIVGVLGYTLLTNDTNETTNEKIDSNSVAPINTVDLSPSDPEDNEQTEKAKQDGSISNTTQTTATNGELEIEFTRVNYSDENITASGIVSGLSSGLCTFQVADSSTTVQESVDTLSTNGSTGCTTTLSTVTLNQSADWTVKAFVINPENEQSEIIERTIEAGDR